MTCVESAFLFPRLLLKYISSRNNCYSCFFFSIFSFFLYPAHVGFFHFLSSALFPSSETMVKDNIYRKPPIYKQHGTVHFVLNTSLSGLVSARCVACCLSVTSFIPVLLLYVLRTSLVQKALWIYMHRTGVLHPESMIVEQLDGGQCYGNLTTK